MVEDHIAYLIEVLGQDAKIIQPPGDVILLSTETKPVREIHWLRMCVPFNDIFFSSERSLTIELYLKGLKVRFFVYSYPY